MAEIVRPGLWSGSRGGGGRGGASIEPPSNLRSMSEYQFPDLLIVANRATDVACGPSHPSAVRLFLVAAIRTTLIRRLTRFRMCVTRAAALLLSFCHRRGPNCPLMHLTIGRSYLNGLYMIRQTWIYVARQCINVFCIISDAWRSICFGYRQSIL